jgi:hypothetical protein
VSALQARQHVQQRKPAVMGWPLSWAKLSYRASQPRRADTRGVILRSHFRVKLAQVARNLAIKAASR